MSASDPEPVFIIDEEDRYSRFRLISWWNQEKLLASKAMVVGAGALGNEVLKNLALLGIGTIFVVDYDTIESSNLSRSLLYRQSDAGKPKVERAAARIRELNPDVKVIPFNGNVLTDVGLGIFNEMDVVIGCLDNREARLWVNRSCWKLRKPWVDGGIQEISGVVKVFVPPESSCYECGMTEMDYRLINLKYSCPLLKREDILQGKVPTAPTISSIIAGMQTQEALKILHGMKVEAGAVTVFNGVANNLYTSHVPRKENCLSHECYGEIVDVPLSSKNKVGDLLRAAKELGGAEGTVHLDRELLISLECRVCDMRKEYYRPLSGVDSREAACSSCGRVMTTRTTHEIAADSALLEKTMEEVGIPSYDIVRVGVGERQLFLKLSNDRKKVFD